MKYNVINFDEIYHYIFLYEIIQLAIFQNLLIKQNLHLLIKHLRVKKQCNIHVLLLLVLFLSFSDIKNQLYKPTLYKYIINMYSNHAFLPYLYRSISPFFRLFS